MNCPHCGCPLPEGAQFCGTCGVSLAQSQPQYNQPQYNQPQKGYGQQMQGGYAPKPVIRVPRQPVFVKMSLCRIIGAVFILLSAILPMWFTMSQVTMNAVRSLDTVGFYVGFGFWTSGSGVQVFWAIMFILIAVAMLVLEAGLPIKGFDDFRGRFNALPGARFYLPGLFLFFFLLATFIEPTYTIFLIDGFGAKNYKLTISTGWWIAFIGFLLTLVAPVVALVKSSNANGYRNQGGVPGNMGNPGNGQY